MATLVSNLIQASKIVPFAPNLFEVDIFGRDTQAAHSAEFAFPDAHLYCTAIKLGDGLELEYRDQHNVTLENYIKGVATKGTKTVSITWRETSDLKVYRYHRAWLSKWFNPNTQTFVSGSEGKKRNARITLFSLAGNQDIIHVTNGAPTAQQSIEHIITLIGLAPIKLHGLDLDFSKSSNGNDVMMEYKVDRVEVTSADRDIRTERWNDSPPSYNWSL